MIPAEILDKPTWRMALHNALSDGRISPASPERFWNKCSLKPFTVSEVKEVLGIAETSKEIFRTNYLTNKLQKMEQIVFQALVLLKDKRYCFFESVKDKEGDWLRQGHATVSKNLKDLLLYLSTTQIQLLKLHHLL